MAFRVLAAALAISFASALWAQDQEPASLQARAQLAIRSGRPAEAVALLDQIVQDGRADSLTQVVYVVALIADGRIDVAEQRIAELEKSKSATPAQLSVLNASLKRVKAAKAVSAQIAPMVERGDVRAALRTLEGSGINEPGTIFARSYLLRLLGEFERAADVLKQAASDPNNPSAQQFIHALSDVSEQQAAFLKAKETFERNTLGSPVGQNGLCIRGSSEAQNQCHRELIETASRAAQSLFDLAPFSSAAVSARLTQAIWLGKTDDALSVVRQSRLNHDTLVVPSYIHEDVWARGTLVFNFTAKQLEWVGRPEYTNGKRQLPSAPIPFAQVGGFSQELNVLNNRQVSIMEAVGFKIKTGPLGGVAQGSLFGETFGEVPLRLAMRAYGRVIAECLSLAPDKYSLVSETPKRGGLLTGMAYVAVSGLAASQGNTAAASEASQNATSLLQKRANAMARDASERETWQREMGNVRLAVDARVVQAEVASLLDGSLIPASERRAVVNRPAPDEPPPTRVDATVGGPAVAVVADARMKTQASRPDTSGWIGRLEGTWRSPSTNGRTNDGTALVDSGVTLVLRVGGEGLLGTLRFDQTFTGGRTGLVRGQGTMRFEVQADLTVNVNGRAPVGTLLQARFYQQGQLVPGSLVTLNAFNVQSDEIEIDLSYAVPGTGATVRVERVLDREVESSRR